MKLARADLSAFDAVECKSQFEPPVLRSPSFVPTYCALMNQMTEYERIDQLEPGAEPDLSPNVTPDARRLSRTSTGSEGTNYSTKSGESPESKYEDNVLLSCFIGDCLRSLPTGVKRLPWDSERLRFAVQL